MPHRIKLLGDLEITSKDGLPLELPAPTQLRLLVALALRPGQSRPVSELSSIVWDSWEPGLGGNLETPISRIRHLLLIDKVRGTDTYRTHLDRSDVDATDFTDIVTAGPFTIDRADNLLAFWRGDPTKLYAFIPSTEWKPLLRARDRLIEELASWTRQERAQLINLEKFCAIFPIETEQLVHTEPQRRKRLLIVDDDEQLTTMLTSLLHDYHCIVARSVAQAIDIISDRRSVLDGALVDLHLTRHLDSSGVAILSALQNLRPEVPRILLTSSPPADAMTEVLRTYGLYDVLVKDGENAPLRTRMSVDSMLGASPDSARKRAGAAFESMVAKAERKINADIVQTRKRERRGEYVDPSAKERLLDELTGLEDDVAPTRSSLKDYSPERLDEYVEAFYRRWLHRLSD